MRTALGVLAGYAIFAVSAIALFALAGREPHEPATALFMVASTVYGMVFAFVAGYVAGAIARRHDRMASTILAVVIAVIAGVSTVGARGTGSVWSQLATIVVIAPCVLAGGAVHHRRKTP